MSDQTPLFEFRAVTKRYLGRRSAETVALAGVTLSIPRGAFVVVSGPSGGGKTTLLSLLGALDVPTEGSVHFEGRDLSGVSEAERSRVRRRIGFVFQSSPMIRGLSVWQNVTYGLIPTGVDPAQRRKRAATLLDRMGLSTVLDERPAALSGGELQRVGIARALAGDPVALLADEPTSNLDRASSDAIVALLADTHRAGTTVVVVTHDPRFTPLATRSFALDGGRLE